MRTLAHNTIWLTVALGSLWLLGQGLADGFYIENTEVALAQARRGSRLVAVACLLLIAAATYAVQQERPRWVAGGLMVPVVLCGGLTLLASETLLPQLSVVVAYPAALAAAVGGMHAPAWLRSAPARR